MPIFYDQTTPAEGLRPKKDQPETFPTEGDLVDKYKLPVELSRELMLLRGTYNEKICTALFDPATKETFLRNPATVFDMLCIPLSEELRKRLHGRSGLENATAVRHYRLPQNRVVNPTVRINIVGDKAVPVSQNPKPVLRNLINPFANIFKPSGLETHGYQVVLEFSKKAINDALSQMFDKGLFNAIMVIIGKLDQLNASHLVSIDMGVPPQVIDPVKKNYPNVLAITVTVPGEVQFCIAASVMVAPSPHDANVERIRLDCAQHLAYCSVRKYSNGGYLENSILTALLQLAMSGLVIPVAPDIPIDKTGKTATKAKAVDVRVIKDTASSDKDAIAILLMLPAGTTVGDPGLFTNSFVADGAGVMVDFSWLRSMILPTIETSLGLPGNAIDRNTGVWIGESPVPGDPGSKLTMFAMGVMNGTDAIFVGMQAIHSGTCYTVRVTGTALVSASVDLSELVIPPPQITISAELDIPWYCYVLSILAGGVIGGIVLGPLGTLIGSVITPIIIYTVDEAIKSAFNNTMQGITDALTSNIPTVDVDFGQMENVKIFAHIDDLVVLSTTHVLDGIPGLRSETVFVPNGGCIDFVNGTVTPACATSSGIVLVGVGANRVLTTAGNYAVAFRGQTEPRHVTRCSLYPLSFASNKQIPISQIAPCNGSAFVPNLQVWATTSNAYYSYFIVTNVAANGFTIQYKTYPREYPVISLEGSFGVDTQAIKKTDTDSRGSLIDSIFSTRNPVFSSTWGSSAPREVYCIAHGIFTITPIGLSSPWVATWKVQGQTLSGTSGKVVVSGITFAYSIKAMQLELVMEVAEQIDIQVPVSAEITITDAKGKQVSAAKTATASSYKDQITGGGRPGFGMTIPKLDDYIAAYKKHIGPWTEIDPEAVLIALNKAQRQ